MLTNRRTIMMGAAAVGAAAMLSPVARAAAPMQGVSPANVHRYMVGGFEVTALLDFARPGDKPETIFGTNQKPEDVAALLQANFLPADKFVNMFTPIVVNTGKELVLFDTGLGAANGGQLQERLKAAGFEAGQIDVVVITHCHPDHIGGVATDGKANFPNARYVIGETEYGFWSAPERMSGPTENAAKLVAANVTPFKDKMTFLKNESEVVCWHPRAGCTGPYAGPHGLSHREQRKAHPARCRLLQSLCAVAAAAGLGSEVRCRQGHCSCNAHEVSRHAGGGQDSLHQLPYALPVGGLRGEVGRWRLPLRPGDLSAHAVAATEVSK